MGPPRARGAPAPPKHRGGRPRSERTEKARTVKQTARRVATVQALYRDAAKTYGKSSRSAEGLKEHLERARRWELEARHAKSLSAKQRARAKAGHELRGAKNAYRSLAEQPARAKVARGGWVELGPVGPAPSGEAPSTHIHHEHARRGSASVLSLLEARSDNGLVRVDAWRTLSQTPTGRIAAGEKREKNMARLDALQARNGWSRSQRADIEELLDDADLYGVEVDTEIENYTGEGT